MILILCPEISPRTEWTFELVFNRMLGLSYRTTNRKEEFEAFEGPKIGYSTEPLTQGFHIPDAGLLNERGVYDQSYRLNPGTWHNLITLFHSTEASTSSHIHSSTISFDLLSAIFFLVTRYEEYLPFTPDEHGRFPSTESVASKLGFLGEPIVNLWVHALGVELEHLYGHSVGIKQSGYRFIPTIDVDNAWAYAHKGWWRTLGGFWRDRHKPLSRNFRFQVLRENQPDPYDTYDLIDRFHREAGCEPVWFFLTSRYGEYDRNISCHNLHYQNLIRKIARKGPVGVHPSYDSHSEPARVAEEVEMLSRIIGQPVTRSRQHFLRLHFPSTFRAYLAAGIREDYSLGYADQPGFRAGIATPFRFFDLEAEKSEELTVFPFQIMDQTFRKYLNLDPDEALEQISAIIDRTRAAGGTLITLWHNESLSEWNEWTDWSEVYRQVLKLASSSNHPWK